MAQFVAKNLNDLNKDITELVRDALVEVAEKVCDKLRAHVDEEVYINQNKYYADGTGQPTYELRDSITNSDIKVNGKEISTEIFHDKDRMSFRPDDFVHGSRYWKDGVTDIRDLLPKIIDQGLSGDLFGEGWWTEPRPYFTNTIKELKDQGLIKKWFVDAFTKRGIQVVK